MCDDETKIATSIAVAVKGVPNRSFRDAIAEVRRSGRPFTLDAAEAAMEELGGASQLGKMIVEDLKKVRGDHLHEAQKEMFEQDFKTTKGLYDILIRLNSARDELVGSPVDPLDGLTEDDLMAVASQAAIVRLKADAEFRKQLLFEIADVDPDAVMEIAMVVMDRPRPKAGVIVVGEEPDYE